MSELITADLVRLDVDWGDDKHDVIRALAGVVAEEREHDAQCDVRLELVENVVVFDRKRQEGGMFSNSQKQERRACWRSWHARARRHS